MSDKQENKKQDGERGISIDAFREQKSIGRKKTQKDTKTQKKTTKSSKATKPTKSIKITDKKDLPEFETLKIHTSPAKESSKIIIRDVAKTIPSVEQALRPMPTIAKKPINNGPASVNRVTHADKSDIIAKKPVPTGRIQSAPMIQMPVKLSSKEIKEREIKKALDRASKVPQSRKQKRNSFFKNFGVARIALATACTVTAIFAIVYFIDLTSKDMSMQVAAVQSGIEASYPSYIPRGYDMSDVTSSHGKITMNFKSEDGSYTITEEASSWDSDGLLDNYVKEHYGDGYAILREQGLTIYMGSDWETWVNGGLLYKLTVSSGVLTKKQMKTIATSFQ